MNSTNLFVANVISISTLTLFLDRMITGGDYKTFGLVYDMESARDNNLIQRLTNDTKYNANIVNINRLSIEERCRLPSSILHIVLIAWNKRNKQSIARCLFFLPRYDTMNVIMVIQKPSGGQREFVSWLNLVEFG